ncbi:MAG: F0F1 ATP synthase subunit A [Acidobacteriota bacterium]
MEHEISAVTAWSDAALSNLLGRPVQLPDQAVVAFLIVLGSLIVLPPLSRRFSLDRPGIVQHMLEIGVESINSMLDVFIGKNGRQYFPVMGTFAFFILVSNLVAFIPGFQPPTADLNTTVALALLSFLYYNYIGIRTQGMQYLKQFVGDPIWLFPLMIPIEILSHLSRPLSLSVRLFGNIFGEHTLAGVFFILLPVGLPVVFAPLGVFVAFLQTFVFVMLSMIYIAGAIEHGH